jgi:hypothetical protein
MTTAETPAGPGPAVTISDDIVAHAAQVLANPADAAAVWSLADHLTEWRDDPVTRGACDWLTDGPGAATFLDACGDTPSTVTRLDARGDFGDRRTTPGRELRAAAAGRAVVAVIHDAARGFDGPADVTCEPYDRWWRVERVPGRGAGGRRQGTGRVTRVTPREVLDRLSAGGLNNVLHGVLGAHYFVTRGG